jgi:tetratricopeptide (TPR) repeat protein
MKAIRIAVIFFVAFLALRTAHANEPKVVVVLPLDVSRSRLDGASKLAFEETIRTVAGDILVPLGFHVLTGETTLKYIVDNGLDPERACTAQCALDAARELKAQLFISGSIATTEGEHLAFVRLFESDSGQQLTSLQLEGKLVRELRTAFKEQAQAFFARALASPMLQEPRRTSSAMENRRESESTAEETFGEADALVRFRSEPAGAMVELDGEVLCQQTPCSRNVTAGDHLITMKRETYETFSKRLPLAPGTIVSQSLTPTFALVTVETSPPGLSLSINGKGEGKSPIVARPLAPGTYDVAIDDACWLRESQSVTLAKADRQHVTLKARPRLARVKVTAELRTRDAVEAAILLHDQRIGTTPAVVELPICTKQIEVATADGRRRSVTLTLKEGDTFKVQVVFPAQSSLLSPSTVLQPILARAAARRPPWPEAGGDAGLDSSPASATDNMTLEALDTEIARLHRELNSAKGDARKGELLFTLGEVWGQKAQLVVRVQEEPAFEAAHKEWSRCKRENPPFICGEEPKRQREKSQACLREALAADEEVLSRYPQSKLADAALFAVAEDAWRRALALPGAPEAEREQRQALNLFAQLIAQYPASPLVGTSLLRTGEIALQQNDLVSAQKAFEEANRKERGQSAHVLYRLAAVDLRQDRLDSAIRRLKEAYTLASQARTDQLNERLQAVILRELVTAFEQAGESHTAFEFFRQVLGKDRAKHYAILLADASLERAGYDFTSRGYENTISSYRHLLQEYPLDPLAPEWLAALVLANDKMGSETGRREHISALVALSAPDSDWSRANALDQQTLADARALADALRRFNTRSTR